MATTRANWNHASGKTLSTILVHVDDFQIASDPNNKEFARDLKHIRELYRWGMWKDDSEGYTVGGVDVIRTSDGGFALSQEKYARSVQPLSI